MFSIRMDIPISRRGKRHIVTDEAGNAVYIARTFEECLTFLHSKDANEARISIGTFDVSMKIAFVPAEPVHPELPFNSGQKKKKGRK